MEWKLDGARVQAHRRGDEVRLFTRNLNDVTDRLGGVVDVVRALPGGDLVLDGEVLGVDDTGTPRPFQDTMGDFGSDGIAGRGIALKAFFFDVLHAGTDTVVDEPLAVRRELLTELVPVSSRLPGIVTADAGAARAVPAEAVDAGHEGVMVKALDSVYDAGRRGRLMAQGQAGAHVRSGGARRRMGPRTPRGWLSQPPSRRTGELMAGS